MERGVVAALESRERPNRCRQSCTVAVFCRRPPPTSKLRFSRAVCQPPHPSYLRNNAARFKPNDCESRPTGCRCTASCAGILNAIRIGAATAAEHLTDAVDVKEPPGRGDAKGSAWPRLWQLVLFFHEASSARNQIAQLTRQWTCNNVPLQQTFFFSTNAC
ncbi:hypothetical protein BKA80DRAFT_88974 [Phyllosticta citrichinensis]